MNLRSRLTFSVLALFFISAAMFAYCLVFESGGNTNMLVVQGGLMALALLVTLAVIRSINKRLLEPLEHMRDYAAKLSKGKLDSSLDGEYLHELAVFRDALGSMVSSLKDAKDEADKRTREADAKARETKKALDEAKAVSEKADRLAKALGKAANRAKNISQRAFESVNELSTQVEQVNRGVDVQRDRMAETATAMEEMNSTVMEVANNAASAADSANRSRENAQTGAEGVRRAVTSIEHIQTRILSLKETMSALGQQAQDISRIMNVITDIADQTNLLALNAAIEAARAGEAGRGFAVVADEVRKLAEKTMQATKEVGDAVSTIQSQAQTNLQAVESAAEDIVESTEAATESGRFMDEIVDIVHSTSSQVDAIAGASREQSLASEEINRAVSDVTRVAGETASGMEASARALMEISGLMEELDAIIGDMATMKDGTEALTTLNAGDRLVEWNSSLVLGIETIDSQHRVLVDLINELHAAMKSRSAKNKMVEVVNRLKDYTVNHFQTEEKLFARHGYPDTDSHKVAHDKFVEQVLDFEESLKSGKLTVTMDVMRFLRDWLVKHIQGVDKRYVPFLKEKGVK